MKKIFCLVCACFLLVTSSCSCKKTIEVPSADDGSFDMSSQTFGVDKNVNISTIDKYLGLDNVAYRDMRLLVDSAGYDSLIPGTSSGMLTATIEGFRISPLPYIVNLWEGMLPPPVLENPVEKNYTPLYTVIWNEDGSIYSMTPNYKESENVLNEIFPKDKLIFLMCGGGGYAWMTKQVLVKAGYDATKVYNIGGFWGYSGDHKVEMVSYYDKNNNGAYEGEYYSFYNGNYMAIDTVLSLLTPVGE